MYAILSIIFIFHHEGHLAWCMGESRCAQRVRSSSTSGDLGGSLATIRKERKALRFVTFLLRWVSADQRSLDRRQHGLLGSPPGKVAFVLTPILIELGFFTTTSIE